MHAATEPVDRQRIDLDDPPGGKELPEQCGDGGVPIALIGGQTGPPEAGTSTTPFETKKFM
jgi:hypothetical protein